MAGRIVAWSAAAGVLGLAGGVAGWWFGAWPLLAWGTLLLLGGLGALFLGSGRDDGGEGILGVMLLQMDRWGLGFAAGLDAGLAVLVALAMAGMGPGVAWNAAALIALGAATVGTAGLLAWIFSAGRGTARTKAIAGRHHAMALVLSLAPWAIRAFLPLPG